jgi:hypothetical protein
VDLRTTDEFAQWFSALDDATAEDVAATLEVIAQLGAEKEAPGSSEWLTWYEHPSLSARLRELNPHLHPLMSPSAPDPALVQFIHAWGVFNGYAKRVVKHLESRAFVARIGQLDEVQAAAVTAALSRIKKEITRRALALSEYMGRRFGRRSVTAEEQAELARFVDAQEVRDAYLAALAAAGFELVDLPAHSHALREIALRTPPPGLRLLYGVDPARNTALVVLGERFDRTFYGDSVRRAERQWREFLDRDPKASQPVGAR